MVGGAGDPVRELMERHRRTCEQAVDALEIAAALEDSGIGPGEAARYRHADVFSLAEELYARVPRRPPRAPATAAGGAWRERAGAALRSAVRHGLPVVGVAVGCAVVPAARGPLAVLCGGWLAWAATRPAGLLGSGSGRAGAPGVTTFPGVAAFVGGAAVALALVVPVVGGGPVGVVFGVAAAVGAGAVEWAAGWLRRVGRGHLGAARTIADFRARMRPVLPVAVGLHVLAVAALGFGGLVLLTAAGPAGDGGLLYGALHRATGPEWAGQAALGAVLLPAVVLFRCGRPAPALAGLAVAGAGGALLTVAQPGPVAQLLACSPVAAVLLPYAWLVLGRPGAHRAP
ncbi:hypothetical protein ACIA8O_30215 [Kitasatospora sp. NPDC051853]|uniref:hypothetical protein n=1 Tax=Kitasatospora sp. NPDC051853 TaxID=3364058 RepID=UPI0037B4C497